MLTQDELNHLLTDMESDRVERTRTTDKPDKFGEAVCAFANDLPNHRLPGYLLIGVNDDGTPAGLTIDDKVLQTLGAIRSDGNVLPQPALTVQKFSLEGGDVAVVEVQPSDLPPVRYKGRVCVRIGPRKGIANEQEERILSERRVALARSFDARPCPEAKLLDLGLGLFDAYRRKAVDAETIAANHRSIELQLASLRFFDLDRASPTNAGVLLFCNNPQHFFPGAYVQFLHFPGESFADTPIDQAEVRGDLFSIVREMEIRIRSIIHTAMTSGDGFQEKLLPDYPEQALRELFMNAVMHRNYESNAPVRFYVFRNRIEIANSGGLFGEASRAGFPPRNDYRNPIIAEALKAMGYVNRFGYGIARALLLLEQNGNPAPVFDTDAQAVEVKVFARSDSSQKDS
jgi:ATP-dependent DNA helicase RecG